MKENEVSEVKVTLKPGQKTIVDEAMRYVGKGWPVVKIPTMEKHPSGKEAVGWENKRYTVNQIPQIFSSESNIGIQCGEISGGLVDVDLDSREARIAAQVFLPPTAMIHGRPGSPCSHYWYICRSDVPEKVIKYSDVVSAEGDRKTLIELRSNGCQTLVPPSIHTSGEPYIWESNGEPGVIDGSVLTEKVKFIAMTAMIARHWQGPGRRHDCALAVSGLLARAGVKEEDALKIVETACRIAGDTETSNRLKDVSDTYKRYAISPASITGFIALKNELGKEAATSLIAWSGVSTLVQSEAAITPISTTNIFPEPWEIPVPIESHRLPEFPHNVFPEWLENYVDALADHTQTPRDLSGMMALSVLATCVARKIEVEPTPGWRERLNIWTVTAMDPGSRKSAVVDSMITPIELFEERLGDAQEEEVRQIQSRRRILEARLKSTELAAARAMPVGQEALEQRCKDIVHEISTTASVSKVVLIADDCTPEALTKKIFEQGGRMAILSAEGDAFDIMAGRYSANGPNLGVYLRGHAGDPIRYYRSGNDIAFVIRRPALTIGMAVQPGVIKGLRTKSEMLDRGLLARFLFSIPRSNVGSRSNAPMPVDYRITQQYNTNITNLLNIEYVVDEDGRQRVSYLKLSPEANLSFEIFRDYIEDQLRPNVGKLGDMADWGGKLCGVVSRIAALLHIAEWANKCSVRVSPCSEAISGINMQRAVQLGAYLIEHAMAAYAEMGSDTATDGAKKILRWVLAKGVQKFSRRQVHRELQRRFKNIDDLKSAIKVLKERGYIRDHITEDYRDGYEVNPHLNDDGSLDDLFGDGNGF